MASRDSINYRVSACMKLLWTAPSNSMRAPAEMAIKGVYKKNYNKNGVSYHSSLFYPFCRKV